MPFNHIGNTANGNALGAFAGHSNLTGRTSGLAIYEVDYDKFRNSGLAGQNLDTVVQSMEKDNNRDLAHGYRQPTDHDDRLGNLPVAPGGKVVYREYYLSGNAFTQSGFVRLVADIRNKRLFVTPTHYDVWLQVPADAANANTATAIAATDAGARNPFYLLRMVRATQPLFD